MLQYPINVKPDNAVAEYAYHTDHYAWEYSYTFKGDIMSGYVAQFYDYATGKRHGYFFNSNNDMSAMGYNNSEYKSSVRTTFEFGNEYVWDITFVQFTPDGSMPVCDMPVLRGSIVSGSGTNLVIDKGIETIYPFQPLTQTDLNIPFIENGTKQYTYMQIQIENERRNIVNYNKKTGALVIDGAFSTAVTTGTRYQIFSNFLTTPQYYFKILNTPTITHTFAPHVQHIDGKDVNDVLSFKLDGTYSQSQLDLIKYWNVEVESYQGGYGIAQKDQFFKSENIYSQNIEYKFFDVFITYNNSVDVRDFIDFSSLDDNTQFKYKTTLTTVSQDNQTVTDEGIHTFGLNTTELTTPPEIVLRKHDLKCAENPTNVCAAYSVYPSVQNNASIPLFNNIYRLNLDTREVESITIGNFSMDAKLPNKGRFKYALIPFDDEGNVYKNHFSTEEIDVNFNHYTITELNVIDDDQASRHLYNTIGQSNWNKPMYETGWTFYFDCNISDTSTTLNTGNVAHTNSGEFANVTTGESRFESGSFQALLGSYDAEQKNMVSNSKLIRSWEKFISQDKMFLFKSAKGNVRIIAITDASIECVEASIEKPITVNFSWVEVADVRDVIIGQGVVSTVAGIV